MSKVVLKFQNVANDVVHSMLEINCVVDLVQTDGQFMLKAIENVFYRAFPGMIRRAVDQTMATCVNQMAHYMMLVCRQIVTEKSSLILIWNISDDIL